MCRRPSRAGGGPASRDRPRVRAREAAAHRDDRRGGGATASHSRDRWLAAALSATANTLSKLAPWRTICARMGEGAHDGRGAQFRTNVSRCWGAPVQCGAQPWTRKGVLGWGGLGTLIGAVLGVTTGRAHCLVHRVRKECGKNEGESGSTLIARTAGGRHSLTTGKGWWEEATYVGCARTSARDTSPKVPRVLNRADSKQGQYHTCTTSALVLNIFEN